MQLAASHPARECLPRELRVAALLVYFPARIRTKSRSGDRSDCTPRTAAAATVAPAQDPSIPFDRHSADSESADRDQPWPGL